MKHFQKLCLMLCSKFSPKFLCHQFAKNDLSKPLAVQSNHWSHGFECLYNCVPGCFPCKENEQLDGLVKGMLIARISLYSLLRECPKKELCSFGCLTTYDVKLCLTLSFLDQLMAQNSFYCHRC